MVFQFLKSSEFNSGCLNYKDLKLLYEELEFYGIKKEHHFKTGVNGRPQWIHIWTENVTSPWPGRFQGTFAAKVMPTLFVPKYT